MDGVRTGRQGSQSLGQAGSGGSFEDTVLSALPASLGQSHLASSGPGELSRVTSSTPAIAMGGPVILLFIPSSQLLPIPAGEGAIGKTMHSGGRGSKRNQKVQNINPFVTC